MKGLQISREFFHGAGVPWLAQECPEVMPHAAGGLVGEGSECWGTDDDVSRDHDWGAGFCLWLPRSVFPILEYALLAGLRQLETPSGVPSRFAALDQPNDGRVGVFATEDFYRRFTGLGRAPEALREWWAIPDANLATATNGAVFCDRLGEFSRWREALLAGYPRDVRLKKMAYCCYLAFQAGQYNHGRMAGRGFLAAAEISEVAFMGAALRLTYYLNNRFPPFYKWLQPCVRSLPVMGFRSFAFSEELAGLSVAASGAQALARKGEVVDEWCHQLAQALVEGGFAHDASGGLYAVARQLHGAIENRWLASIPLEVPC